MSGYMAYEHQVQVRGPDGTILWAGSAIMGVSYRVRNDEASTAMELGEGVRFNTGAATVLPRLETTAAGASPTADLPQTTALGAIRTALATDTNMLGVTMERIPAGGFGIVAGVGSLTTVRCTAAAIGVTTTVGPSGTAGLQAANTTAGCMLGSCMKTNTVASPGTGATGFVGVLISLR